jgi:hypothetical protein
MVAVMVRLGDAAPRLSAAAAAAASSEYRRTRIHDETMYRQ